MSALTDLFQSMANKIRSKTGTATTYTPPQMVADGIDDVFDAGVASATTPITPSNSSPVAMSANTGYKPTENGVAIKSYTSIEPNMSVLPDELTQGSIYKANVNCYAIRTYNATTPSDSSPVALSNKSIHRISGTGYAIESQPTSITPSDSSPVSLSSGGIYKPSELGYAIKNKPASKTPSNTNPPSVSTSEIIRVNGSAGYLYATQQTKSITQLGSVTIADTSNHTVSLSSSVKNYRYILVCMGSSVATNKYYANNTGGGCGSVIIFDSDKWVSGFTLDGGYTTGNSGSQYTRTDTITYSSNTAMIIKHNNNTSRTDYIYGLN